MVLYQICVFGADLKSNMSARVHNVFSLAEILKIFLSETTTDGWTPTHDKSSHGLWPGELKKDMGLQAKKNTFDFIMFISYVINIIIYIMCSHWLKF
jgi:hypothetical protein